MSSSEDSLFKAFGGALDEMVTSIMQGAHERANSATTASSSTAGVSFFSLGADDTVFRKLQMVSGVKGWKFSHSTQTYWVECDGRESVRAAVIALKKPDAMTVSQQQNRETKKPVILCTDLDAEKLLSYKATVLEKTVPEVFEAALRAPNLNSLSPEEAQAFTDSLARQLMGPLRLPETPAPIPDTPLLSALEALITDTPALKPFVDSCAEQKYEAALRFAVSMTEHAQKCAALLQCLVEHQVPLDINAMKDKMGRTPLHAAAINQNFLLYYQMVGMKANSFIKDASGTSAGDYRRQNQLGLMGRGQNPLGGDISAVLEQSGLDVPHCTHQ